MNVLVLDVETTYQVRDGKKNPSPYLPQNKLVSIGLGEYDDKDYKHSYYFFSHSDPSVTPESSKDAYEKTREAIERAEVIVGHNLKFDLNWLRSCGIDISGKTLFDTMLVKYILNRGVKKDLSLEGIAVELGLQPKKSHLIDQYLKDNVTFEDIPKDIVEEYGLGDIDTTFELYLVLSGLLDKSEGLKPTVKMTHEFLEVLMEMEFNGIQVDEQALAKVEKEYREELNELVEYLNSNITRVMGDTPVNLDSPKQMSVLFYSREVKDYRKWKDIFNIGTDERGKKKRSPRLTQREFVSIVKENTTIARKTKIERCKVCDGSGRVFKLRKDGLPYKNLPKCKDCGGTGALYIPSNEIAGLKLSPRSIKFISASGFATDKTLLEELADSAPQESKEFLEKYSRYNAISTYLDTFVDGIRKALVNGKVHTNIRQAVVLTGRLSSSDPSLLNQPRGGTFPVRRAFVSSFPGGRIGKGDYSQLEFRAAGFQSQDKEAIWNVIDGEDIHKNTASVIGCERQDAKSRTFKPLYGGESGTEIEQRYFKWFLNEKYPEIKEWHHELLKTAVSQKRITLPSGREYDFPYARFNRYGGVSGGTKIKNYPVQGFATADIVPCSSILVYNYYKAYGLQSKIILEVHDENVVDLHPDEIEIGMELLGLGMLNVQYDIFVRYGVRLNIPLEIELGVGNNWLEVEPYYMKG